MQRRPRTTPAAAAVSGSGSGLPRWDSCVVRACLRSAEFYFSSPRRQSDRCPLRPFLGHCGTFTSGASPRSLLFPPAFPGGIPDLEAVRCAVGHCDGGAADLPGLFSCAVVLLCCCALALCCCLFVCVCARGRRATRFSESAPAGSLSLSLAVPCAL